MRNMTNPRDVLNELKWRQSYNLKEAMVWYIHRGAENDTKVISGGDIVKLGKSFMETTNAMIPYHRIFKIVYKNKTVFQRQKYKKTK